MTLLTISVSGTLGLSAEASIEPPGSASSNHSAKVCASRSGELPWCTFLPWKGELIGIKSQKCNNTGIPIPQDLLTNFFCRRIRAEDSAQRSRLCKWHSVGRKLSNRSVVVSRRVASHQKAGNLGASGRSCCILCQCRLISRRRLQKCWGHFREGAIKT